jgi:hypothetical protein
LTPCSFVDRDQHSRENYWSIFRVSLRWRKEIPPHYVYLLIGINILEEPTPSTGYPGDGGKRFLQNTCIWLPNYTMHIPEQSQKREFYIPHDIIIYTVNQLVCRC